MDHLHPGPGHHGCQLFYQPEIPLAAIKFALIEVERVSVELKAYEDKKKGIERPSFTGFTIIDHKSGVNKKIMISDLKALPVTYIPHALMAGTVRGSAGYIPSGERH